MLKKNFLKSSYSIFIALVLFVVLMPISDVKQQNVEAATTYNVLFPVNNGCKIAYYYGYTKEYGGTHRGLDIHGSKDFTIYAAHDGKVTRAVNTCPHTDYGKKGGPCPCSSTITYGNYIYIKDENAKVLYVYGHLLQNSLLVKVGDTVKAGQPIATMGSSGYSTGRHLHFEMRTSADDKLINTNPTKATGTYSYYGNVTYSNGPYSKQTSAYTYTDIPEKTYYIKNSSTNTYINASSATNGGAVSLAAKQTTNSFKMKIAGKNYGGCYITPAVSTDFVLNPWTDFPADGDKITMYKKNTDGHQNWKFEKSGSGYIIHCAYNENVVLTAVGTGIQLKTRTGTANQIWILEDVNTTTTVKFHRNLNSEDTAYVTEIFTTGVSNQKFGYKTDGTGRYSEMNDASVGFGQWSNPGYKMLGWSKDKNAKTASWKTYSDVIDSWISSNAPSVDLYAVWEKSILRGDANNDGEVNITDAVILQNWLLGSGDLTNWQNVDLCEDGVIDVFDMVLMRKLIIEK